MPEESAAAFWSYAREDDQYDGGRITALSLHAEDISNRDPRYVGREDVQRTLARWSNPSTRSINRAHLVGFYRWFMQEGRRKDNPVSEATI